MFILEDVVIWDKNEHHPIQIIIHKFLSWSLLPALRSKPCNYRPFLISSFMRCICPRPSPLTSQPSRK
jgi:hypothetical protein